MQYTEIFKVVKNENFQSSRKSLIFFLFLLKTLIVGARADAVLTSTHNLCFGSIIRKMGSFFFFFFFFFFAFFAGYLFGYSCRFMIVRLSLMRKTIIIS